MTGGARLKGPLRPFHRRSTWLAVWVAGWLLCIVLSLVNPPRLDLDLARGDKLGHFLAYAALSAWSVMLFATRRARFFAALSLVLLGVALEFAQGQLTSYRMMDSHDALANTLGVAAGQLLALTGASTWLERLDRRLFG